MKRLFIICIICLLLACSGVSVSTQPPASYVPSYYETVPRSAASEELVVFATPTPEPTEAPTEAPTPEPTEVPTPEPTPDPGFMLAWISDTQSMITLRDLREDYLRLCDWLGEKASDGTIRAVLHSGDMVDDGSDYGQWVLFCEGLSRFEKKIPFYWAVGNHDEGEGLAEPWRDQPFVQALPPEQTYAEGGAYYTILEMKGTRFMLLSVSWHREENELTLEWMKGVCDAHPDLPVVLLIHGYLTADGELMYYAYELEHKLVARCPNIRLILSGHARGISHAAFQYDDDGDGRPDRTVNALMYDIQTDIERYGYICLLHYNPLDNSLSVDSYSPLWDDYIYDDEHPELERFVLYDVF